MRNLYKIRLFYLVLVILIVVALALRLYGFSQPHRFTFDEALFVQLGLQLRENPTNYNTYFIYQECLKSGRNLSRCKYLSAPLFKHPPVFSYLLAGIFKLRETALKTTKDFFQSAAFVSIILGSLTILIIFFIGKYSFDWRTGFLAAFFLTLDPIHWLCSEKIWIESTLGFFTTLALLLFILGRKKRVYFLLSGVSIGLAFLSKYPGILALVNLLTFALIWERDLFKIKEFWALMILPFLISLPWFLWNYQVYQEKTLFKNIIGIHRVTPYLPWLSGGYGKLILLLFFLIFIFLVISRKKENFERCLGWGAKIFLVSGLSFLIIKNFLSYFRFFHFPQTSWLVDTFINKPWYFYFERLPELSLIYLFSFLGWLLLAEGKKTDRLFFVWSFWIFTFFISWRNFQSRYLIMGIPVLLLTSSRLIIWLLDYFKEKKLIQFLIISLVSLFLLKTILIDLFLPLSNDFAYF